MHFKALSSQKLPKGQLSADHAAAQTTGRLSLGEQCLYIKKLFSTAYLPYSHIERAWLREQTIPSGNVEFSQTYLIARDLNGKNHWCALPPHETGLHILSRLKAHNPNLRLGDPEQE